MSYDLVNYSVTAQGNANVSVPRATISCQLVDSGTGALLFDLTGANAIQFPAILGTLTAAQRAEIIDAIAHLLIGYKTGLT